MIPTFDFTIPKGTPKESPLHQVLPITRGLIHRVELQFPAGCAGLVGVVVSDGGFQLWPSTLGNWFITDNWVIAFDEMYLKTNPPFQLDFWGYNLDTDYDHTIYARFGLADKEIFIARYLPSVAYDVLQGELSKATTEQEAVKAELIKTPFPWIPKEKGKG
jgi:hypothetical protein